MEDNMHDVVKLMLARMESHPHEFVPDDEGDAYIIRDVEVDRWWRAMSEVKEYANEEEKKAIAAKLRTLRLQKAHEWAMDELCNGEERRRKEKRERELEEQRYRAASIQNAATPYMKEATQQQMDYQLRQAMGQLSALGNYSMSTDLEKDAIVIRNHDTNLNVAIDRHGLYDTKSPLYTIKKALGLK
jgi:hypothetical protein